MEYMNLEMLLKIIEDDIKKGSVPDFGDIVSYSNDVNREIYIDDIVLGTGTRVESLIRFWNGEDDKKQIPIEDRKPIKLFIDSCGGSLTDTFTIIDAIALSRTPIYTIVTGAAYSGGFFIAIAGHKRFAYKHSSFLFHEGSTSNGGTASQFANFAMFYKKQLEQLKQIVLKYTKITEEKYNEIQKDDYWLDSKEALELGIIDTIMGE